jgi:hypothetical protein
VSSRSRYRLSAACIGGVLGVLAACQGTGDSRQPPRQSEPRRYNIHDEFTVVVPEGVSVRPYMAEAAAVAIVAADYELQILVGDVAAAPADASNVIARTSGDVDGHRLTTELRKRSQPPRDEWSFELVAHISGNGGTPLFAKALCKDGHACAVGLDIVKSIKF